MADNEEKRDDDNNRFDLWKTMEKAQDPTQLLSATEEVESVDFELSPSHITIFYHDICISSESLSEMPSPGGMLPELMPPLVKYGDEKKKIKKKKKKSVVSVVGKSKQKKKKKTIARSTIKHPKPKTI